MAQADRGARVREPGRARAHPDLLPTDEDFDDPEGFIEGRKELDMSAFEDAADSTSPPAEDPGDAGEGPGDAGDSQPPAGETGGEPSS